MSKVEIIYYGHSCFKVQDEKKSVIFDPYQEGSVPGLKLPDNMEADYAFASHNHKDHNALDLIKINAGRKLLLYDELTVPHDDVNGEKRGMNRIISVEFVGCKVTHMGDTGRLLTDEEYEYLKDSDVLMIPCGGFYTIDAEQAKTIIERIHAPLTILMHFRRGGVGYDVLQNLDDIKRVISNAEEVDAVSYVFDTENAEHKIIYMKPKQD